MSNIKDITNLEQDFLEAKEYSEAQFQVILDLQEKIVRLESENKHLKLLVEQNVPLLELNSSDLSLGISNERLICETQINNLKMAATVRDLTLEETRKFETFVNILEKLKKKPDGNDITVRKMSDEELLKLVNNE